MLLLCDQLTELDTALNSSYSSEYGCSQTMGDGAFGDRVTGIGRTSTPLRDSDRFLPWPSPCAALCQRVQATETITVL